MSPDARQLPPRPRRLGATHKLDAPSFEHPHTQTMRVEDV